MLFAALIFTLIFQQTQPGHVLVLQSSSTGAMEVRLHCVDINDEHVTLEYFLGVAGEDCHELEGIKKINSVSAIFTDADHLSDSVKLKRSVIEESYFTDQNCEGKVKKIFEHKYGNSVRSGMSLRVIELGDAAIQSE